MIEYRLTGHSLTHEVQTIAQVFYPNRRYHQVEKRGKEFLTIESILTETESIAEIYEKDQLLERTRILFPIAERNLAEQKRMVKASIYEALRKVTGYRPPWGMLTGIRPAKRINELKKAGKTGEEAVSVLMEKFDVLRQKAELALEVAEVEQEIFDETDKKQISIYIGIPFCPTRCLYCSFPSHSLEQYHDKVNDYLKALKKELAYLAQRIEGIPVQSIYIGGGTPTSLNEAQLEDLLAMVANHFPLEKIKEYTVEAGRPDTITKEKLRLLKVFGTTRISINPQTMNQKTLDYIGRKHSVEDILFAFDLAREMGHNNINMDLILGLPGETQKEVEETWKKIEKMSPESVTVHTLAVKRASRLKENLEQYTMTKADEMEQMLFLSDQYRKKMGMRPYYLYRQKNMVGSFENVGYCKKGYESIYNIQIMEENQTILAAGAGAVTKMVDFETNRIDRIFNVKDVTEYCKRIEEMIQRKKDNLKLYD